MSPAKTAAPIEMPFGLRTPVGPMNHVLLGGPDPFLQPFFLDFYISGAHWRHVANTTKPSMCGGDAALCQNSLNTCSPILTC